MDDSELLEFMERISKQVDAWPDWMKSGWAVFDKDVYERLIKNEFYGTNKIV